MSEEERCEDAILLARNRGVLSQQEKTKKQILPESLQSEHRPGNTLLLAYKTYFGLLIPRTVR